MFILEEILGFSITWGIFIPLLIGSVGNLLCIAVKCHRDVKSPIMILIIALAISDTSVLITKNIQFGLNTMLSGEMYVLGNSEHVMFTIILKGVADFALACSIYFVVGISLERYLVMKFPLQSHVWNTWKQKWILVIGIMIWSFILAAFLPIYLYTLLTIVENEYFSEEVRDWLISAPVDSYFNTFAFCIIPLCLLIPSTILMCYQMFKIKRTRHQLQQSTSLQNSSRPAIDSVTIMLIVTVIFFAICATPMFLYSLLKAFPSLQWDDERLEFHEIPPQLSELTFILQCSINFWIYLVAGSKFRKTFCKVMRCKWSRTQFTGSEKRRTVILSRQNI